MTEPAPEPTEPVNEPQEPANEPVERTYSQAEWDELKSESIKHRKRAAMSDTLREALQEATIKQAVSGVLVDPTALPWDDAFNDPETGLPDTERVRAAAASLLESKPWLGRVTGDVGQGFRGEDSSAVDLAGILRAGA